MKDVIQWALISLLVLFAALVGADMIGIDLAAATASMLSFLQTIGLLLLIFTGSAAAIEVAKYFRRKHFSLEDGRPSSAPSALSESELELMLKRAMSEAMSPLREDVGKVRAQLEQERKKKLPDSRFEQRGKPRQEEREV